MFPLTEVQSIQASFTRLWCLAWNCSGTVLAATGEDKTIRLFAQCRDLIWESQSSVSEAHKRSIRNLTWSPCGSYLASASFDGTVVIWKFNKESIDLEALLTLEGHTSEVKCVAWCWNGHFLATCGRDRSVWFWEFDDDEDVQCIAVLQPHSQDVKSVSWHPFLEVLVSTSYDNTINLYREELDDWSAYIRLTGHTSTVWKAEFSTSGDFLASCSDDRSVKIWASDGPIDKAKTLHCIATLTGDHSETIFDLAWSPNSEFIATCGADNLLCVYKFYASSLNNRGGILNLDQFPDLWCRKPDAHKEDLNCVRWCPNNNKDSSSPPPLPTTFMLATCSDDGCVKFWSFADNNDNNT